VGGPSFFAPNLVDRVLCQMPIEVERIETGLPKTRGPNCAGGSIEIRGSGRWRRFTQPPNTSSKNWSGATDISGDPTAPRSQFPSRWFHTILCWHRTGSRVWTERVGSRLALCFGNTEAQR
jgi:hypothetical protein